MLGVSAQELRQGCVYYMYIYISEGSEVGDGAWLVQNANLTYH